MMRVPQSLTLFSIFGFLGILESVDGFAPFGSLINHVFSCDCFIAGLPEENTLFPPHKIRQKPAPFPKSSNLNVSTIESIKNTTSEFGNKQHPKLIIFKNTRQKVDKYKNEIVKETTAKPRKIQKLASMLTIDNMLELLEDSKKLLVEKGWLQDDPNQNNDGEIYSHTETTEEAAPLFSMNHGMLSKNFRRFGEFMELFDKFDCRCAGNFSAILKAKRFVRFTVAHL